MTIVKLNSSLIILVSPLSPVRYLLDSLIIFKYLHLLKLGSRPFSSDIITAVPHEL